jgi:hypothetical protein
MSAVKGLDKILGSLGRAIGQRKVAHGRGRNLKDVGDQALMRGFGYRIPEDASGAGQNIGNKPLYSCAAAPDFTL